MLNMVNMVRKAAVKRKRAPDALVEECLQHIQTAQVKCAIFRGREETLEVYIFYGDYGLYICCLHLKTEKND